MVVVEDCDAEALGRCEMTIGIMMLTTVVVNSPWLSSKG